MLLVIPLLFVLMTAMCCFLFSRSGGRGRNCYHKGNLSSEFPAPVAQQKNEDDLSSDSEQENEEMMSNMMAQMLEDAANQVKGQASERTGQRHGVSAFVLGFLVPHCRSAVLSAHRQALHGSAQDRYIAVRPAKGVDKTGRHLTRVEQWTEASLSWWTSAEEYLRDAIPNGSIPLSDITRVYQNSYKNPLQVVIEYHVTAEGAEMPDGSNKGERIVESMLLGFPKDRDSKNFAESVNRCMEILRKHRLAATDRVQKYRTT